MTDQGPGVGEPQLVGGDASASGIPTDTWPMWGIALLPLLGLLRGVPGFAAPIAPASNGPAVTVSVALVPLVAGLLLAAVDRRILAARGLVRPLHWGWAALQPVYVIGRSVVVHRRVRGSLIPLWAWLGLSLLVAVIAPSIR